MKNPKTYSPGGVTYPRKVPPFKPRFPSFRSVDTAKWACNFWRTRFFRSQVNVASVALHEVHVLKQDSWIIYESLTSFWRKTGRFSTVSPPFLGMLGRQLAKRNVWRPAWATCHQHYLKMGCIPTIKESMQWRVRCGTSWYISDTVKYEETSKPQHTWECGRI